ncbi:hypothetical protein LMB98_04100 [Limosilactobacillus reuteri]|uniref:hypothetical protein n=1 Tax=Limosilactobacillus reuteri TaxID=1598 RepID=UPI001E5CA9E2|nr:hypothetical protein [Limosilactobacillus reuteri]MCC4397210.1 hypothetical protein [Limosilactobacillus reuteri]MCC4409162.1 hypothetical protein [Limosilactobacillus reuteri]
MLPTPYEMDQKIREQKLHQQEQKLIDDQRKLITKQKQIIAEQKEFMDVQGNLINKFFKILNDPSLDKETLKKIVVKTL